MKKQRDIARIVEDELAKDFNTIYALIETRREKAAMLLSDRGANVWSRKKALNEVLFCNNAQKALVRIMGSLEDAIEDGFMPSLNDYTLEG